MKYHASPTCRLRTESAILALSRRPNRLMMVKSASTMTARHQDGKGRVTSPARYSAAVAEDTMEVEAKSSSSREAPATASALVETFSLYSELEAVEEVGDQLTSRYTAHR